jgi:uncharacterized protein YeaO (DUF488 family)
LTIHIVRLGSDRINNEGIRIGTVRHPPRGVPKDDFASKNWYDVWLPNLSPSPATMKFGKNVKSEKEWLKFERKYRAEMTKSDNSHIIELLASMSHSTNFSVGCYCEQEERCHRSILRKLLKEKGANIE